MIGMATTKVTVSLDTADLAAAQAAATEAGVSLSAWLSRAARERAAAEQRVAGARALADFMAGPDGADFRDQLDRAATMRGALLANFPELAA
jgi:hypothetical protein